MLKGALKNCVEWSQEEKNAVQKMFNSSTYAEMSQILGRSESSIRHMANKMGLKKSTTPLTPCYKYQYDRNFFHDIVTEEQSYWLGFIAADGNICIQKERKDNNGGLSNMVSIELAVKDIDHLKMLNKHLKGNIPVTTRNRGSHELKSGRTITGGETCMIRLYSNQMVQDLLQLNIVPNKTYDHRSLPVLSNEQLNIAFLRGYFDGNGSFFMSYANGKKDVGAFDITTPNLKYAEEWRTKLYSLYNIASYIAEVKKVDNIEHNIPCYKLCFKGLVNSYYFGELIYKDASIYLPRKYNKYHHYLFDYGVESRIKKVSTYKDKLNASKVASLISND